MSVPAFPGTARSGRAFIITLLSLLISAIGLTALSGGIANAAPGESVFMGAANVKRNPLCPERCSGLAIVSGFQAKSNGVGNAYRVPFVGKVTSWRLALGKPDAGQRKFFQDKFGARPEAAIGVLARKVVKGEVVYKLRRRSAIQGLNRVLGTTATFKLAKPMNVNKGDYVALIVPTWAPALADPPACEIVKGKMKRPSVCANFQKNNSWVASRNKTTCMQELSTSTSQPQVKVNSVFSYGCRFHGALTYGVNVESR